MDRKAVGWCASYTAAPDRFLIEATPQTCVRFLVEWADWQDFNAGCCYSNISGQAENCRRCPSQG